MVASLLVVRSCGYRLVRLEGSELDEQQAAALKQFIEDIGGLENAIAAVAMLDVLEKAA